MTKILVFGKNGQVARALKGILSDAIFVGQDRARFESPENISNILSQYQPDVVINAAAYTLVDKAESEKELCFKINAEAPKAIAEWCALHKSLMIHFSTDYVYGGQGGRPQAEDAPLAPVNVYGWAKKAAEEAIRASGAPHVILRTSWVFDEQGTNFLKTMLRLGSEREELKIVCDQVGAPSYAKDLAAAVKVILSKRSELLHDTYNLCNSGFVSWSEYAKEIFSQATSLGWDLKVKIITPIKTSEYETAAVRPLNSRLNQDKIKQHFGIVLPPWQDALQRCLLNIQKGNM